MDIFYKLKHNYSNRVENIDSKMKMRNVSSISPFAKMFSKVALCSREDAPALRKALGMCFILNRLENSFNWKNVLI